MRVLLTGASGLLGYATYQALLQRGHEPIGLYHTHCPQHAQGKFEKIDLTQRSATESLVLNTFPDAIIHTAALSSPQACQDNPRIAHTLNVDAVAHLSQLCHHVGARLVYVSTNMVFGKTAPQPLKPYRETDKPQPLNLYGTLKLKGEQAVLDTLDDLAVVLRIPLLTGNSPQQQRSFHEKLLARLAESKGNVEISSKTLCQPTCVHNVADVAVELLERPRLKGIFHWAGNSTLSPLHMGRRLLEHYKLDPECLVAPPNEKPVYLEMATDKLQSQIRTRPTSYEDQLPQFEIPKHLQTYYADKGAHPTPRVQRWVKGKDF